MTERKSMQKLQEMREKALLGIAAAFVLTLPAAHFR